MQNLIIMKTLPLQIIVFTVATLLLIPMIAMQFSESVVWTVFDFLVAAVLLSGTGLAIELVLQNVTTIKNRIIFCRIILAALFLIWTELAVGIFGSPIAGLWILIKLKLQ